MSYVSLITKGLKLAAKNKAVFRIKPEITMPVNAANLRKPLAQKVDAEALKNFDVQGELGNVAIRQADHLKSKRKYSQKLANQIFGDISEVKTSSIRTKDANSIYSKYEKNIKDGKTISTEAEAQEFITDAVGMRFQLKDLTIDDAMQAVKKARKFNQEKLTTSEQRLVRRLFRNDPTLTASEIEKAEELAKPVKMYLAEQQSNPVFNRMLLCNIKSALERKVTTIEKLKQCGFDDEFLKHLNDPEIIPLRLTRKISNYKGLDGIPYYSDNQIMKLENYILATGDNVQIQHCSDAINLNKYNIKELSKREKSAIKDSGYITTQMNVILPDGTLAEVQFRGSNLFAEYEHIAHDSRQLKNTLGKTFDEYKQAIKSLNEDEYNEYNAYLRKCYNYYRNSELGIMVGQKPKLPAKFPKILSQESMESLYKLNESNTQIAMQTFKPHLELVA